jgi:hypothetical protein
MGREGNGTVRAPDPAIHSQAQAGRLVSVPSQFATSRKNTHRVKNALPPILP